MAFLFMNTLQEMTFQKADTIDDDIPIAIRLWFVYNTIIVNDFNEPKIFSQTIVSNSNYWLIEEEFPLPIASFIVFIFVVTFSFSNNAWP